MRLHGISRKTSHDVRSGGSPCGVHFPRELVFEKGSQGAVVRSRGAPLVSDTRCYTRQGLWNSGSLKVVGKVKYIAGRGVGYASALRSS
jgi:hypothetical protein